MIWQSGLDKVEKSSLQNNQIKKLAMLIWQSELGKQVK